MLPYEEMTHSRRSWPWWRWALMGLSTLALALSAALSWHFLVGRSMIGCGGGSPCDQVLSSRWSTMGGVLPVSGLAVGAYLTLLVAGCFLGPATATPVRRLAWGVMLVLVGAAAGCAVWFTIVQKWIIGAFCPYCMTTHVTGLLLAVLVVWRAARQREEVTLQRRIGFPLIGLALAGLLAACQIVFVPPAAYVDGESQDELTSIDPHAVPIVGSPDAPTIVTLLFDYQCPHCQQIHFMLSEVIRRYHGTLAFALCPTPLNNQCNPYIPPDVDQYQGSCELAKMGLAVWVAKHEALHAFENWMFTFESGDRWHPRSLDAARTKAIELVGQDKFEAAWADPWIETYLQTCLRIYGQTIQNGNGGVPRLVFGSRWVIPEPYSADDLVKILQDSLGVPGSDPNSPPISPEASLDKPSTGLGNQ